MARTIVVDSNHRDHGKAVIHSRVDPDVRRAFYERFTADGDKLCAALERALRAYVATESERTSDH